VAPNSFAQHTQQHTSATEHEVLFPQSFTKSLVDDGIPRQFWGVSMLANLFVSEACGASVPPPEHTKQHTSAKKHKVSCLRLSTTAHSVDDGIPCNLCGVSEPVAVFGRHAEHHETSATQYTCPASTAANLVVSECARHSQQLAVALSRKRAKKLALVPCLTCGANVALKDFATHVASHEDEWHIDDLKVVRKLATFRDPAAITLQAVEMVQRAGFGRKEIVNFNVFLAFVQEMQRNKGISGGEGQNIIEIVYHWSIDQSKHRIVKNGLQTNNDGSIVQCTYGAAYGSGIYTAVNLEHGRNCGKGASSVLLCLALPGKQAALSSARALKQGEDSLKHEQVRVYRKSCQLVPLFLVDKEDERRARDAAQQVMRFLKISKHRIHRKCETSNPTSDTRICTGWPSRWRLKDAA